MSQASPNSIRSFLAWTWGGFLIAAGALFLGLNTGLIAYRGPILPLMAGAVAAISLPFLGRWIARGREPWAISTAWIFLSLGLLLLVMYLTPRNPQLVATAALAEIGLALVGSYLGNRHRWGLLIPAYIALALGGLIGLTVFGVSAETLAGVALLIGALPFWAVYAVNRRAWWAMALAGALSIAGAAALVFFTILQPGSSAFFIILNGTLAAGLAGLWLLSRDFARRVGTNLLRFDLALWLAVGFAGAAILSYWYPSAANWGLVALSLGGYIVYRQVRGPQVMPQAGPTVISGTARPAPAATPSTAGSAASSTIPNPPLPGASPAPPAKPPSSEPAPRPVAPPPGIEFRPIDPFKTTKSEEEK